MGAVVGAQIDEVDLGGHEHGDDGGGGGAYDSTVRKRKLGVSAADDRTAEHGPALLLVDEARLGLVAGLAADIDRGRVLSVVGQGVGIVSIAAVNVQGSTWSPAIRPGGRRRAIRAYR